MKTIKIFLLLMIGILWGCTPAQKIQKEIMDNIYQGSAIALNTNTSLAKGMVSLTRKDSNFACVANLYELDNLLVLNLLIKNNSDQFFKVSPDSFYLMSASSLLMRRIEPHEAANIYVNNIKDVPQYQPKTVMVTKSSSRNTGGNISGWIDRSGWISGSYSGNNTKTTSVSYEAIPPGEIFNMIAYNLWASDVRAANQVYSTVASQVFDEGLIPANMPPESSVQGALYWVKKGTEFPITIRGNINGHTVFFKFYTAKLANFENKIVCQKGATIDIGIQKKYIIQNTFKNTIQNAFKNIQEKLSKFPKVFCRILLGITTHPINNEDLYFSGEFGWEGTIDSIPNEKLAISDIAYYLKRIFKPMMQELGTYREIISDPNIKGINLVLKFPISIKIHDQSQLAGFNEINRIILSFQIYITKDKFYDYLDNKISVPEMIKNSLVFVFNDNRMESIGTSLFNNL